LQATQSRPSPRRLTWSVLRIDGLVILLFLALTVLMLYPLSVHPATRVADQGDPLLLSWMLAWCTRALFTDPLHFYDSNIFYPFPHSLAFSDPPVGAMPLSAPIWWITGNPVLAHNVAFLAAFFLSCVGAYLLTKKLTSSVIAGVFAGVIFAFPPYRLAHLSHLDLSSAYWMPVALLFLHRAFTSGRWSYFLGFAGSFVLQCFCSLYYGFFFTVAIALYLIYLAIFKTSRLTVEKIGKFAAASLLAGMVLIPFGLPFLIVNREYGVSRRPGEVLDGSADLVDYLAASPTNVLYGQLTSPLLKNAGERALFPGLLPPLLALIGIWGLAPNFRRRAILPRSLPPHQTERAGEDDIQSDQGYYVLLVAFAFLLSLGPRLQVGGKELELTLPYGLLYSYVPGFKAFRCPARFDVLVMLGLAVLAGQGIARMEKFLAARGAGPLLRWTVSLPALAIVLLEYAAFPVRSAAVEVGSEVPAVYRWLAQQGPQTTVMELPINDDTLAKFRYDYFSTYHWCRLVNGHASFLPPDYVRIMKVMEGFPEREAIELSQGLRVNLVVVHGADYPKPKWATLQAQLKEKPGLTLVQDFGDDRVYQVASGVPSNATATAINCSLELPTWARNGALLDIPITLRNQSASLQMFPVLSKVDATVKWTGPTNGQTESALRLPLFLLPGEVWTGALTTDAPGRLGEYALEVHLHSDVVKTTRAGRVEVLGHWEVTSEQAEGLHASWISLDFPREVSAGRDFPVQCEVRNDGPAIWLFQPGEHSGWVGLGIVYWLDARGEKVRDADRRLLSGRIKIPRNMAPRQSVVLSGMVRAPAKPGLYTCKLDMISELVAWFEEVKGSTPMKISVKVK
jgi:hypothetical protein